MTAIKKKVKGTKIMLMPEGSDEDEQRVETESDEQGIYLGKDDIKLLYNALAAYKPTKKEAHLRSILLEQFEEILVVDYDEPSPDAN